MPERSGTHYWDLLKEYQKVSNIGSTGTGVLELSTLIPRTGGKSIFQEGEDFSGITRQGNAETCMTMVAGPHVKPTLDVNRLVQTAEEVFHKPVFLPSLLRSELVSPQLCVWFRDNTRPDAEAEFDLASIYDLPPDERRDFSDAIGDTIHRGTRLLNQAKGRPTIWGTWGAATLTERIKDGTSRGGPTMKRGHIHISNFDITEQDTQFDPIDWKKQITHLAPWVSLAHQRLQEPMRQTLEQSVNNSLTTTSSKTEVLDQITKHAGGTVAVQKGYTTVFNRAVPLPEAVNVCVELAGRLDEIYQYAKKLYEGYYKCYGEKGIYPWLVTHMGEYYQAMGLPTQSGQALAEFFLNIQPTYAQLKRFAEDPSIAANSRVLLEKKLRKYERFRERMRANPVPQSARQAIMYDTFKNPQEDTDIDLTWPAHASFCYVIDDYNLNQDGLTINSMKLFPDFVTSEAAVERLLGVVLQRPTTQTVLAPSFKLPEAIPVAA